MNDLVSQLVGALEGMLTHMGMDEDEWNKPTFDQARAALTAAKAGGWVAVQNKPVAWMRKWAHEGEEPQKIRNENGRMAWPLKFKLHPVTQIKCLSDDVPLYAPLPNPPKEQA